MDPADELQTLQRELWQLMSQMDQHAGSIDSLQQQLDEEGANTAEIAKKILEHGEAIREIVIKAAVPYRRLKKIAHTPPELDEQFAALVQRFGIDPEPPDEPDEDLLALEKLVVQVVAQLDQQLATLKDLRRKLNSGTGSEEQLASLLQQAESLESSLRQQTTKALAPYRHLKQLGQTTPKLDAQFKVLVERFGLEE